MARKHIELNTLKRLLVLSGNECAHPECTHPIFNEDGLYIAQLCHIEAANKNGARFNESQTDEERASFENLIFMCYRHHKESDFYTKEDLVEMKRKHEISFCESHKQWTKEMLRQVVNDIHIFWSRHSLKSFENEDLKIHRDSSLSVFDLMSEIDNHMDDIESLFDSLHKSDNELEKYANIEELRHKSYKENPFFFSKF